MKVTLDYAPETGEITDNGAFVANIGINYPFTAQATDGTQNKTKDLVSLKDAGFSADEIMQMKREGLI